MTYHVRREHARMAPLPQGVTAELYREPRPGLRYIAELCGERSLHNILASTVGRYFLKHHIHPHV